MRVKADELSGVVVLEEALVEVERCERGNVLLRIGRDGTGGGTLLNLSLLSAHQLANGLLSLVGDVAGEMGFE
uniref:Uncharacterized protein n=1 Tax=Magnetococcus massalia (strain MO-1) TaxID=451514 RepID=A0A1S7LF92_MAGMO|nr:protein of unknown function [Candidatus Magnetococcus massalia]